VTCEPRGLLADQPNARPADVLVTDYNRNGAVALDVVVINPKQNRFLPGNRSIDNADGVVAAAAEADKENKWGEQVRAKQIAYIAFASDVFGRCSAAARSFIQVLAKRRSEFTGLSQSTEAKRMWQLLSVNLMRDNANACLAHDETPLALIDDEDDYFVDAVDDDAQLRVGFARLGSGIRQPLVSEDEDP